MKEEWVCEYEQCSEDRRHFISESWQIPSIILGINGVLLGVAYNYLSPPIRGILILFGASFSSIFTYQIMKLASRSNQRIELLKDMEEQIGREGKYKFRRYTGKERRWLRFPLRYGIIGFLIVFTIFLFLVGAWNLIPN